MPKSISETGILGLWVKDIAEAKEWLRGTRHRLCMQEAGWFQAPWSLSTATRSPWDAELSTHIKNKTHHKGCSQERNLGSEVGGTLS